MTPELPPRFAVLSIAYDDGAEGIRIRCTTDVACHLFCRISTKPPRKHRIPVIVRGYPLRDDYRWCFTVYHDNEQEEDGDTPVHSFIKVPWPFCETRYFYFWGTVAGVVSPSTSPLFKKHRSQVGERQPWEFTLIILETWEVHDEIPELTVVIDEKWSS